MVDEVVGTAISLIAATPVFLASSTAGMVVAESIAFLAAFASWSTKSFKALASSVVNGAFAISAFLPATALSMAALATSLSIASLPLSTALFTSSSVFALSMASWAFLASESI